MVLKTFLLAISVAILAGCAQSPVVGAIYTNVKHGTNVGTGDAAALKSGQACAQTILGLFAFGDSSVEAAARNGNVEQIAYVDHQSTSVLFFYGRYCTIVKGR